MALHFEHRNDGGVLITAEGIITSADLIQANDLIYGSDEKIKGLKYQIWDFTEALDLVVKTEDLRALALQDAVAAEINPAMIIAIISPRDFGFGMGRMWEALVSETGINTHVYRTREEAEAWVESRLKSGD